MILNLAFQRNKLHILRFLKFLSTSLGAHFLCLQPSMNHNQKKQSDQKWRINLTGFHVSSVQFVVFKDQGLQAKTASVSVLMFVITVAF